jgi:hypothetical protein
LHPPHPSYDALGTFSRIKRCEWLFVLIAEALNSCPDADAVASVSTLIAAAAVACVVAAVVGVGGCSILLGRFCVLSECCDDKAGNNLVV